MGAMPGMRGTALAIRELPRGLLLFAHQELFTSTYGGAALTTSGHMTLDGQLLIRSLKLVRLAKRRDI